MHKTAGIAVGFAAFYSREVTRKTLKINNEFLIIQIGLRQHTLLQDAKFKLSSGLFPIFAVKGKIMMTLDIHGKAIDLSTPKVMGILNVTPDSFSDGGLHQQLDDALRHCERMLDEGAAIIDIGGCSTRPDNAIATEKEELGRVLPMLKNLREAFPTAVLSIDTFRKNVAEACYDMGADIINDISGGLFDPAMLPFIGIRHIPYVMMHCVGTPETMHHFALDGDIHQTIHDFFVKQCEILESFGKQQIILDPGIGFGKSLEANYALLRDMERYRYHDYPILIGISRKSMIGKVLGTDYQSAPEAIENGTAVLNALALQAGGNILRVHDVKRACEVVKLYEKVTPFSPSK